MSDLDSLMEMLGRVGLDCDGNSTSVVLQVGRYAVVFAFDDTGCGELTRVVVRDENASPMNTCWVDGAGTHSDPGGLTRRMTAAG